jgi:hypothetical protein
MKRMKKNCLIIGLTFAAMPLFSVLPAIPNAGLENWTKIDGADYPDSMFVDYPESAGTYISKTTVASEGNFAVKLMGFRDLAIAGEINSEVGGLSLDYKSFVTYSQSISDGFAATIYFHDASGGGLGSHFFSIEGLQSSFKNRVFQFDVPSNAASFRLYMKHLNSSTDLADIDYTIIDNLKFVGKSNSVENILAETSKLKAAPNPAGNSTTIFLDKSLTGTCSLSVIDLAGKQVVGIETLSGGGQYTLNTSALRNGVYFVKVTNFASGQTEVLKLLVKNQ